jgi:hypothetical protein
MKTDYLHSLERDSIAEESLEETSRFEKFKNFVILLLSAATNGEEPSLGHRPLPIESN